jgi:hypothetical protein
MGMIEQYKKGYRRGKEVVEIISDVSKKFGTPKSLAPGDELKQRGISEEDIWRLYPWPTLNPEKAGHMMAGIVFHAKKAISGNQTT